MLDQQNPIVLIQQHDPGTSSGPHHRPPSGTVKPSAIVSQKGPARTSTSPLWRPARRAFAGFLDLARQWAATTTPGLTDRLVSALDRHFMITEALPSPDGLAPR
ncbi:hypothetical protein [Nonomuraea rhodomycinica]|uniref:Uncharacterized protein n=1 Tax=Nonomuraea rhodomycinica TaxID=1712872 RepID=A0A7Y6ISI2_9ACTN|nr:hypothetical protein [Nonomuraea rhodomycinica]NUW43365.1 hypothetical protein [Nonomuraea rhodomycinica]